MAPVIDHLAPYRARLKLGDFAGRSLALANVLKKVEAAAKSDVPIFFNGFGSGCGKSMLARIVHDNSARRDNPFVQVECASIPRTLSERELVGFAGAEGGASETTGKVGLARGGTLFLREVSSLSSSAQSHLLHLLRTNGFSPGASSRERPGDVRVIASNTCDPVEAMASGRLSEALFLHLNEVSIVVPPLDDRPEDIVPLAQHFCRGLQRSVGIGGLELSTDALKALEAARWYGQARQVEHMVQSGAIRASQAGSSSILSTHIFCPHRSPTPP